MADERANFRVIRPDPNGRRGLGLIGKCLMLIVFAVTAFGGWKWFIERVEVPPGQLLALINKMGNELPVEYADQIVLYPEMVKSLAAKHQRSDDWVRDNYRGIRHDVRTEGRHFVSPIWYEARVIPATIIPDGEIGVLIRKYGKPLPPGKTVATLPDERGPVSGTLPPGRHNINTLAYEVQTFKRIVIPEGHIGVQTLLSGPDPSNPNEFVVQPGERGVQSETLGPGTYMDKNPFEVVVDVIDIRSQKYDMLASDAIEFPSADGFPIRLEATVEWAIYPERAPWVLVEIGDAEDVVTKIIRPYAMSLARIEGSKLPASKFIGAREEFQHAVFDDLRNKCREQGVQIKAASIRDLKPPEPVRAIIRDRELADQLLTKYDSEIAEAVARAQRVEQEELAKQQSELGEANRQIVTITVKADQGREVSVTEANQRLDVAQLDLDAARKEAEALLARGQADARVVLFGYQAEAEPLRAAVAAFGDGQTYARFEYLQKIAPAIRSILTNTEGPFADLFHEFSTVGPPRSAGPSPGASNRVPLQPGVENAERTASADAAPAGGGQ